MTRLICLGLALVMMMSAAVAAQWPTIPTRGVPRLPDGKADLKHPAPKTPDGKLDLSGMWQLRTGHGPRQQNIAGNTEVPFQPWAAKLYEERRAMKGVEHPRVRCLPRGVPNAMMWRPGPFKFVHTPDVTLILFEEFVTYRQVFTDGRPLPQDAQPAWWGYSTGRWEPDAFVVESTGFKDLAWLDFDGHPATESMRITERFRRPTLGELEVDITFDDPKAYTRPWTVTVPFDLMVDTEFIEHVCENEQTYERLKK